MSEKQPVPYPIALSLELPDEQYTYHDSSNGSKGGRCSRAGS